jgi:hypothetical protein
MTCENSAPPAGLEPATRRLEGGRSIQLSYRGLASVPDQGKVSESSLGRIFAKREPERL